MTICYFTASGNCLYVARRIGGTLLSIPQLMRQESIEIADDAVGIVCPVYNCEMPMMVREFMRKARIRTEYFFFVYTYGMGFGEAYAHARLAAQEAGLTLSYVNAIQMVDNFIPYFDMQEQIDTLPRKDVEGQLKTVCGDIAARKSVDVRITAITKAQMAMYHKQLAQRWLRKDTALSYTVNDSCIHCGICAKVCPANNITVTRDKVEFSAHCEVCYACLHNCPQSAIHMPLEAGTAHFRNEHVTLNDIIEANE
ncbi:MAG: EFR1 family ferrodoxin [Oscillospiraceae bacterium]|nr:EFR1 family ferrodoxin [Oscillospiraceae bacterium]